MEGEQLPKHDAAEALQQRNINKGIPRESKEPQ